LEKKWKEKELIVPLLRKIGEEVESIEPNHISHMKIPL
jgi:hypothetical protein